MNETLRVVDCDVHPFPIGGANSIMRYLPKPWQERFLRKGSFLSNNGAPMRYTNPNGIVVRADARSPAGKLAGSDPHYVIADLIEANVVMLQLLQSWFLEDLSGWIRDLGATVNVAWMQQIDLDTIDRADLRPDPRLHDVVPAGGADPRHPQGTQTELRTLSPPYVEQVFEIIQQINRQGTTIFMVEQNANLALSIARCVYVLQTSKVVLSGSARELRRNRASQEAYLGELQVT